MEFDIARWSRVGASVAEVVRLSDEFSALSSEEQAAEQTWAESSSDGMLRERLTALRTRWADADAASELDDSSSSAADVDDATLSSVEDFEREIAAEVWEHEQGA